MAASGDAAESSAKDGPEKETTTQRTHVRSPGSRELVCGMGFDCGDQKSVLTNRRPRDPSITFVGGFRNDTRRYSCSLKAFEKQNLATLNQHC